MSDVKSKIQATQPSAKKEKVIEEPVKSVIIEHNNNINNTKSLTKALNISQKERSIENLLDDDEYDATPGADERG